MASESEDRYFRKQEAEMRRRLRQKMERAAREAREERRIKDALETTDEAVIGRIRGLGFDGDTVRVFTMIPLVYVAWADGTIQVDERRTILESLEKRGVEEGSEAWHMILSLLDEEHRPSDEFFEEVMEILQSLLKARGAEAKDLIDLCVEVADASRNFFGMGAKISHEERERIRQIADGLGDNAKKELAKILG